MNTTFSSLALAATAGFIGIQSHAAQEAKEPQSQQISMKQASVGVQGEVQPQISRMFSPNRGREDYSSVDIIINTQKRTLSLTDPRVQKNPLIDTLPQGPYISWNASYKPVRSVSFAVSDDVRFLIGNSRQPVQLGLVITLDSRKDSLTQIGIGKRKNFTGIMYQRTF